MSAVLPCQARRSRYIETLHGSCCPLTTIQRVCKAGITVTNLRSASGMFSTRGNAGRRYGGLRTTRKCKCRRSPENLNSRSGRQDKSDPRAGDGVCAAVRRLSELPWLISPHLGQTLVLSKPALDPEAGAIFQPSQATGHSVLDNCGRRCLVFTLLGGSYEKTFSMSVFYQRSLAIPSCRSIYRDEWSTANVGWT